MKEKKRLEIVWETLEKTTINFKGNFAAIFFCQTCQTQTLHLTISESARILKFSEAALFRLAETGGVNYLETETGALMVCRNSLLRKKNSYKKE